MNDFLKRYELSALDKATREASAVGIAAVMVDTNTMARLLREIKRRRFLASRQQRKREKSIAKQQEEGQWK
ncbi:MAG: hypothetical protein ACI3WU_00540 [Phascolarctobacterium sp.]